jgi:hypothetical protein
MSAVHTNAAANIDVTEVVSPMCAAALVYAERGWHVFPANSDGRKKSEKAAKFSNGHSWGKTIDAAEIRTNYKKWPCANIGIATGADTGFFVVEADTLEGHDVDGIASLRELEAVHGTLPETLMAESPSGSQHHYFRWPLDATIISSSSKIAPGVDVLGEAGMVIAPPSVRPGKGEYKWLNAAPIADAPQWLIDLATAGDGDGERVPSNDPEADPDKIAAAFAVIPNNDAGFDVLNDLGMAAWRATGGSEAGFQAWAGWCAKSLKFGHLTAERRKQWKEYFKYPPNRIGAGTIFYHADQAQPGWSEQYDEEALNKAVQVSLAGADELVAGLRVNPDEPKVSSKVAPKPEPVPPKTQPAEAPAPAPMASSGMMPVDLWASFPPPDLPAGLLPKVIENYARAEAKTMGADVAGIAMGALTVCAATISGSIQLQVKKNSEHWKESARLWCALIGDPSSKKTPILRQVAAPLARIDARLYRKYAAEKAYHDNLPPDEKKKAIPPKQRRVRIEDTTIEAAQEVLKDSPDGVLCLQDELSGWFGGMDKYSGKGAAKDRGFWLQSFNGGEYVFNRISRGPIIIENLSVSMLGGIQPEPMRKLAADSVDDGLLQRLCPIILRASTIGQDEPDDGAWKVYDNLVDGLHMMRAPKPNFVLSFDDGAQKIRKQLEQKHHDLMNCEAVNKKLSAHIGKYDGLFARLCVLWHCIETVGSDRPADLSATVTENTASRVAKFMHTFMLPHGLSFYAGVLGLGGNGTSVDVWVTHPDQRPAHNLHQDRIARGAFAGAPSLH